MKVRDVLRYRPRLEALEDRWVPSGMSPTYIVDSQGNLFTVDLSSGAATFVATASQVMFDIALSPSNQLFGVGSDGNLYQIDATNGATTLIGQIVDQATGQGVPPQANGLDFRQDGTLYLSSGNSVFQVDTQTAMATMAFSLPNEEVSAGDLAFDPQGDMFVTTRDGSLVEAPPDLSGSSDVGSPGAMGISDMYGLVWSNDTLLGFGSGENAIYQVDPTTGMATQQSQVSGATGMAPNGVYGATQLPPTGACIVGSGAGAGAMRGDPACTGPTIQVTSLTWNTTPGTGGVNYKYSITGTLPAGTMVTAAMFWTNNANFSMATQKNMAFALPSQSSTGNFSGAVNAAQLESLPAGMPQRGTPFLALAVDPMGVVPGAVETNNSKSLSAMSSDILGTYNGMRSINTAAAGPDIRSSFTPLAGALTLNEAAALLGYNHFNWYQQVTVDPFNFGGPPPYTDFPAGGYAAMPALGIPANPADNLPYYLDEPGNVPGLNDYNPADGRGGITDPFVLPGGMGDGFTLTFHDMPSEPRLMAGQFLSFVTSLVGVQDMLGVGTFATAHFSNQNTFRWDSNYNGAAGHVTLRGGGDPPGGAGGVFNLQTDINPTSLPAPVLAHMIADGAQGLSVGNLPLYATGADAGGGPQVNVYSASTGALVMSFFAYDPNFHGGVRVALGDVNGDGIPDIITGPGPDGGPEIRIFDGKTGADIRDFFAFDPSFSGGVFVASGDVNGDGFADIIVGADAGGGPQVTVFSGRDNSVLMSFFPYDPNFHGGVRVAAGDVNGDGKADVITGAGPGGGPQVTVFSGADGSMLQSFFPYDPNFHGGVYVASGDVNGDGHADIITGAGPGGGPQVTVFSGADGSVLQSFFPYDPNFHGGVRVGNVADPSGAGFADIITAAGPGGGPDAEILNGVNLSVMDNFFAFDPNFSGGVFVGGA
jgi:hypothetical protein